MVTRLYTGDDGQSHFEELDMDIRRISLGRVEDTPPASCSDTTSRASSLTGT